MKTAKTTVKTFKVIAMSATTKEKLFIVATSLKGKKLFLDKIVLAKKTLSELKSLPI